MYTTGLDELIFSLTNAGKTIARKAEKIVDTGARKIKTSAVRRAPRGHRPHPGPKLAESIVTEGRGTVREVQATADHARFVENGTSVMAPQPFMGPAADEVEPSILAEFENALEDL